MDSDGLVEYFLKWKGYSDEENTWEPLENVETEEIIIEYEKKNKGSVFSRLGTKKESDDQETKIESIENGKDDGEISKDTTTTTNDENKSDQSSEEKFNVDGVVFQFNSKVILFEFTIPERDAEYIGEIKTQTLKLNKSDEGKSIPNDVTDEDIGNYIHVGDELKCLVQQVRKSTKKINKYFFLYYVFNKNSVKFQSSTLETFSYEEEQEEIGNDGDIQKANK